MSGLLAGKTAVVTGAGRGVGRACAVAFAREGAQIGAISRTEAELDTLADEILRMKGKITIARADVSDESSVGQAFEAVERELGPIGILINNAAVLGPAEQLVEAEPREWFETYRVNVLGSMLCARAVLPEMIRRRSGKIVNVSSGAALVPIAGYSAYSSSKAALIQLTNCLAEEVKEFGINVNTVAVWARTQMWEEMLAGEPMPAVADAANRRLEPGAEENVGAILFLASPASDHVTGQYLAANSLPDYLHS